MTQNVVNIITSDFANPQYENVANKTVRLHLVPVANKQVTLADGSPGGGVFNLKPGSATDRAGNSSFSFLAYWVKYKENGGKKTWLGLDADLMFTATMSGCSFGLGSRTPQGVMAAHVNSTSVGGKNAMRAYDAGASIGDAFQVGAEAQTSHQHLRLMGLGAADKVVHPHIYMPNGTGGISQDSSTVFGVRETAPGGHWRWNVFWQRYAGIHGTDVRHLGLKRFINGVW